MSEATQNRSRREAETRAVEFARPTSWRAPELLPSPDARDGWTHRWVRISLSGNSDPKNISSSLREGYEPCKADDYPELQMHASTEGRFKGNVEVGGLLLCRIPTEFMIQRARHYDKLTQSQSDAVENSLMRQSDARMPLFNERKSSTSFGKGS